MAAQAPKRVAAEPFSGGKLTLHSSHVDLLGDTIISDRVTAQPIATLNELRRKNYHVECVRMSDEELATAIGVEVLDEACVDIRLVAVLAVGLPAWAGVFSDGSAELGVFRERCSRGRKSRNGAIISICTVGLAVGCREDLKACFVWSRCVEALCGGVVWSRSRSILSPRRPNTSSYGL